MTTPPVSVHTIKAGPLEFAYLAYGAEAGWPCILGHGFPYDVHAYDEAAPNEEPAGDRPSPLAHVVAELDVRRRYVRSNRERL